MWVCFSGIKLGPLIVCDTESVNVDRYLEILENGAMKFIDELLTPSEVSDTIEVASTDAYLFIHDNAPCHTATKVTNYWKQ